MAKKRNSSIISKKISYMRYIRYITLLHLLHDVTLRYIAQKMEFLNSFVSLTVERIISIIFMRVCACTLKPCLIKKINIRVPAART